MPERPFVCTPSSWIYDQGLNRVSVLAEILFRRLAQCSDQDWRFSSDPHVIRGEALAMRPGIRVNDIERGIGELAANGAIVLSSAHGRSWLQISDHLRYKKGSHVDSRWGDQEEAMQQSELPMVTPMSVQPKRQPRAPQQSHRAQSAPQSAPIAFPAPVTEAPRPAKIDGEDLLMFDLGNQIGEDALLNGGIWRLRFRADRVAMSEAMGDLRLAQAAGKINNPAAWLTDRFERVTSARKTA